MVIKLKSYKLSDYIDFTFCSSGISRKIRIISPILLILIWISFIVDNFYHFAFFNLLRTEIKVLSAIGLLIFIIVALTLYRVIMAFNTQKYLNSPTTIEFTEDQIIENSSNNRLDLPKSAVTKIIISGNKRIFIYYEDYRAILICKNSFEDKNIWNELLSFIYNNYNCDNFVIKKM